MDSVSLEVGIDVSKDHLDVCIEGHKPFRIPNTLDSCKQLALRLAPGSTIHLEASGGYERTPRAALRSSGFEVRTLDPLKVRRMAQAKSRGVKTDPIDAAHLARCGRDLVAQGDKSEEREALANLSRAIDEIKRAAGQMKLRAQVPGLDSTTKKAYWQVVRSLTTQALCLEKEFVKRVKASSLREKYELALTVPCVGACTARVVICETAEDLGPFTASQIASYAGVAPIDDSSGKRASARVRRGNARLKAALYMPALGSIRFQPWAKDLYARLRAKGRGHQQAIVAVMRRLLIRLIAVLKRGSAWQPEPISP